MSKDIARAAAVSAVAISLAVLGCRSDDVDDEPLSGDAAADGSGADPDFDSGSDSGAISDAGVPSTSELVHYVDGSLSEYAGHDGSSWALSFAAVQDGIAAASAARAEGACDPCEVWVAHGCYTPTTDVTGEDVTADPRGKTFALREGVALYGGFAGGESSRAERDIQANETMLSGDLGAVGEAGDNAYHVVIGATGATIDGFTIARGNADGGEGDAWEASIGGGMLNAFGSPTVANCTFEWNEAVEGGGMVNYYASPIVTRCIFRENAAYDGGGMLNGYGSPVVTSCQFLRNSASAMGGAMLNEGEPTDVPVVTNCVLADNTAEAGAGVCNTPSSPVVTSCTFAGNAAGGGADIYNAQYTSPIFSEPTVRDSILWSAGEVIFSPPDTVTHVSSSDVRGGYAGAGNIDADPLFSDPEDDLRLLAGSPCRDTGDSEVLPEDLSDLDGDGDTDEQLPLDLDGSPRIAGAGVDLGAYELQP